MVYRCRTLDFEHSIRLLKGDSKIDGDRNQPPRNGKPLYRFDTHDY